MSKHSHISAIFENALYAEQASRCIYINGARGQKVSPKTLRSYAIAMTAIT